MDTLLLGLPKTSSKALITTARILACSLPIGAQSSLWNGSGVLPVPDSKSVFKFGSGAIFKDEEFLRRTARVSESCKRKFGVNGRFNRVNVFTARHNVII